MSLIFHISDPYSLGVPFPTDSEPDLVTSLENAVDVMVLQF